MPQKVIKLKGINRAISEYQTSGECEELINMRVGAGGSLNVVMPKRIVERGMHWESFHEHEFGDVDNHLVVDSEGNVLWVNAPDGAVPVAELDPEDPGDVALSFAGNVMVVYDVRAKRQLAFKFEDGAYAPFNVSIRPIREASVQYAYSPGTLVAKNSAESDTRSEAALNAALHKAASGFHSVYTDGLCGAAVVGCTYELEDGTELWSTAFVVANAARCAGYIAPSINDKTVTVTGARKVSLHLVFGDAKAEGVRRINVYASRPVFPYEVEAHAEGTAYASYSVNELTLADAGLDGQVMYWQGSVGPDAKVANVVLDFGMDQAGERIMDVTQGCITRTGRTVSYNNRFHVYDSEVRHIMQVPTVSVDGDDRDTSQEYWVAYVLVDGAWKLVNRVYRFSSAHPNDFIYPMAGVERLAFVRAEEDSRGDIAILDSDMFFVDLSDSRAYNYSYAFDVTPSLVQTGSFLDDVQPWGDFDTDVHWKTETNAINVSEQFNPFVFPVEYSYSIGGRILDVVTSYMPVGSTRTGRYPITVFTTSGIFALTQGSGSVLYGNVTPVQPLVITGRATSTPYGIFFVSSNNLYVLAADEAVSVSGAMLGECDTSPRRAAAYGTLCCGGGLTEDFSAYLSDKDFGAFIRNAVLVYDAFRHELVISSRGGEAYSYVFNIDTRQFHKIDRKYHDAQNPARYVLEELADGTVNLVDLYDEVKVMEQPVLAQSRPLALELFYTHVQRLIMHVDANLVDDQHLFLSVFASDNLHDWKCIISTQKKDAVLRHVRTNKAAKSYREYILLITGAVSTDTDISDIIADYTVVQRRLG